MFQANLQGLLILAFYLYITMTNVDVHKIHTETTLKRSQFFTSKFYISFSTGLITQAYTCHKSYVFHWWSVYISFFMRLPIKSNQWWCDLSKLVITSYLGQVWTVLIFTTQLVVHCRISSNFYKLYLFLNTSREHNSILVKLRFEILLYQMF